MTIFPPHTIPLLPQPQALNIPPQLLLPLRLTVTGQPCRLLPLQHVWSLSLVFGVASLLQVFINIVPAVKILLLSTIPSFPTSFSLLPHFSWSSPSLYMLSVSLLPVSHFLLPLLMLVPLVSPMLSPSPSLWHRRILTQLQDSGWYLSLPQSTGVAAPRW